MLSAWSTFRDSDHLRAFFVHLIVVLLLAKDRICHGFHSECSLGSRQLGYFLLQVLPGLVQAQLPRIHHLKLLHYGWRLMLRST